MSYAGASYAGNPYAGTTAATVADITVPSLPTISLYFAPTSPPIGEFPTWVDITDRILYRTPIRWRRGRDHALDEITAGTLTLELDNTDRAFDPSYTAGPYYGDLGPNRLVQLRATWNSVTYPLFTGLIDGLEQRYVKADNHASVFLRATDLFRFLARRDFRPKNVFTLDATDGPSRLDDGRQLADNVPALERERAGARILRVLTTVGVDDNWISAEDGRSPLVAETPEDDNVLDYLLRCARTDLGRFYIDPNGYCTFHSRSHARSAAAASSSQLTVGDDPATHTVRYYDIVFDPADERMLVNHARCGRPGKNPATYRSTASIGQYGEAKEDRESLLFADINRDAADQARYLVARYAQPETRIERVVLKPRRFPDQLWPAVLAYDLGTRVTVERTPVGVGSAFSQEAHIEAVEHTIDFGRIDWTTSWSLSPADLTSYFRLDRSDGTSTLDDGVLLGY